MKTAVDSSVLFDVLHGDPKFGGQSRKALKEAYDKGALVACDIVWTEVRAQFPAEPAFLAAMAVLGVRFDAVTAPSAEVAGRVWRDAQKGKAARVRAVADFLIGAHAQGQADALLTRDEAFYRKHFRTLRISSPGGVRA